VIQNLDQITGRIVLVYCQLIVCIRVLDNFDDPTEIVFILGLAAAVRIVYCSRKT